EPPGRHITEIDRGRAETPDRTRELQEALEEPDQPAGVVLDGIREARAEQRVDERARRRDPHGQAVEPRALSTLGGEQLVAAGMVAGADDRLAVDLERQRRAEDRQAVRVVGGAVERIEDPAVAGRGVAIPRLLELLAEHDVAREALGDERAEPALDLEVDLGDEIDRALLGDVNV